ncbi:DUF7332 family protein [Salinigranum halophilum]|uniref:DUF7332 family protein n=1 Tax=Salinigranum halophilum TaxID=2565931 RepID=UPI00115E8941|nr:hypothetical protein [Salinigranum halophilum]
MVPRGSSPLSGRMALLAAVLVVCSAVSPAAAATPGSKTTADRCFPPDGWEFVVGTEGPQIRFVLHLSLLPAVVAGDDPTNVTSTNTTLANRSAPYAAGAFGIEAVATTGTDQIVSLQSGVLFEGVENATAFVSNPFAPFAFVFDYRLTIPAFEGTTADSDYRVSDAPVEGPVEEAACSR